MTTPAVADENDHFGDLAPIVAGERDWRYHADTLDTDLGAFVRDADRMRSNTVVRELDDPDMTAETARWQLNLRSTAADVEPCAAMQRAVDKWADGSRAGQFSGALAVIRLDEREHRGLATAVDQLWQVRAKDERDFNRVLRDARKIVLSDPTPEDERGCDCDEGPLAWVADATISGGGGATTSSGDKSTPGGRRLRMVRASAVQPQAARWLWQTGEYGRIPLGEVSVLAGRGNVGKSPFALWCAARITRGDLPGELSGSPADVLIYASEDSHEHTTVPRLTAAGADLDRVHLLNGTETDEDPEMPLVWARDIDLIRDAVEQTRAQLLVIDPLIDVHRGGANTDRTDDVRAGLRPLVALAHRTGAAVAGVAHFNKQRTGDVASLLSGSHGLRDTVRAVLAFVERPDGERVLGQDKNNLGRAGDDVPRLTYDMASVDVLIGGAPVSQPVFTITGTTDDTLSDVLLGGANDRADLPDDTAWLFELVAAGHPLPLHAKKCADEAERRGFKWDTVSRKARRSGLLVSRQQRGAVTTWVWTLTESGARRAGKAPVMPEAESA
ncbi:AAA family ATPase [Pseudonocardia broussonetiae]|uniref:AAA family ATPase n=1 Tax=Pseudonocardia broussonetiae TaxID=2736640 RepID=A0A6M6JKI1_9PSEU|nr:AAA family ATPase [Pseudonocardia broussonetiae]QJY46939.1 AAA family ATPase [Pseudonocardia broussonetiae]